jgi:hypothetical protein
MFVLQSSKALFYQFCVGSAHHNSTYKTTSAKKYNPVCLRKKKVLFFAAILVFRMNDIASDKMVQNKLNKFRCFVDRAS